MSMLLIGCVKTRVETKIEYVHPTMPATLLSPCQTVEASFETNGELLMSYIELQTAYLECSSKVYSISQILNSYESIYSSNSDIEE